MLISAISAWMTVLAFGLILGYLFGKILFVSLYGEQIRQIIISIPEYRPSWFSLVDLSKPIKPWQFVRVTFFVLRLMGVVFTKHTTVINEEFKRKLPKKIITFLKYLQWMSIVGIALIFIGWGLIYFQ